jgi:hypothetical protein
MWDQVWCRVGLIAAASAQEPAFCASNDMHILSLQSSVGCSPERHTREITHMGLTCVLRFLHPAGPGSYEALSAYKVLFLLPCLVSISSVARLKSKEIRSGCSQTEGIRPNGAHMLVEHCSKTRQTSVRRADAPLAVYRAAVLRDRPRS